MEGLTKDQLISKYRYCASVAFYKSKLFRSHKFKVIEDSQFIKDAFLNKNEEILSFQEKFYLDMLKNDRACERDLFNFNNFKEVMENQVDSGLTFGELADAVIKRKNAAISKAKKLANKKKREAISNASSTETKETIHKPEMELNN